MPVLLHGVGNRLVEIAVNVNVNFILSRRPILRQRQMAMNDVFERSRPVVDLFDFSVLSVARIYDPPGKLHLRTRLCLFSK